MFISHGPIESSGLMAARAPKRWGTLLSCAIHGLFVVSLLSITTVRGGLDPSSPLTVELINLAPPEPPPPAPPPPEPQRPPPPQPPAPQPVKPAPAPRATPTMIPTPAAPAVSQQQPAASQPLMTESTASEAPATENSGAVAVPNVAAREASKSDYAALVWARVMRYRPERVRLRGSATVFFTLSGDGRLLTAEIRQSSGSTVLDQVALEAVQRAAPFPAPPAALAGEPQDFVIPFRFQ